MGLLDILLKKQQQIRNSDKSNIDKKPGNHLFSEGNESEIVDREFNIEEEKSNNSRQ